MGRLLTDPVLDAHFSDLFTGEDSDEMLSKAGFFCVYATQRLVVQPDAKVLQRLGVASGQGHLAPTG